MKQFFLFALLLIGFTTATFAQTHPKGNTNEGIGKLIPNFQLTDISGKSITPASLPLGHPIVVFYFDPDCDHCQLISKWITEQKEMFKGITLLLISWAEMEDLKAFPGKHLPGVTGDVYITKDTQYKMDEWFGYSETPSIYVYNPKWVRTASFHEETKPEILVKFARQL